MERDTDTNTPFEHIEFALEATNSVIWVIDLESDTISTAIGPVETLFQIDRREVDRVDLFFEHVVHPEDLPEVERVYGEAQRGASDQFNVEFRTAPAGDDVRWIEAHARVLPDGATRQLVGISTETTARKRQEETVQVQNERLEELVSVVSHDLRNPLQVARSHLELAQEECDSDHLDSLGRAHERMDTLIENLLAGDGPAKPLTRGTEPVQAVELVDIVESSWQHVETANASLEIEVDHVVNAEKSRLHQLFENLFRNAIEHGGDGVTVTVGVTDDETGFFVADDGSGIPAAERERIFERGYSSSESGEGLGLYIIEKIAEQYDWTVSVTESEAGGARFEIRGVSLVG